ncbi:hypothetical protein PHYSODRAFT_284509 [Phytophthora sojae]|uniref:RxLR effector PexRD54 WY domain-containing protein n=2 Tax=Phytophthora sojae TaxID=67593 RepID=G4YL36_PHYSP|nr:hypothetical protein PHYSODRAFT_284509 [Phytophthora sojae]AEK81169.1 Avh324 [Phytophthora sojae]AEK81170.1 Avh324 [Phytophthora sojae]EGZ29791.1 hypothetical protein PHYSODRAFT_284509 [Phytophthora sojae]|eukprot:XP_009517066.1 hypothetical protein PHYSODRAFT_284509 [Phytophthora sojae]
MRLQHMLLLSAAALSSANATMTMHSPLPGHLAIRHLRADSSSNDGSEERAFPTLDKVVNSLKSTSDKAKEIKAWSKAGHSSADMFVFLKLDEAGTSLFNKPQFMLWVKHAAMNDTPEQMYTQLSRHVNYEDLVTMIQAATKVESTKKIANKLEKAQFDIGRTPMTVVRHVFSKHIRLWGSDPAWGYREKYIKYLKKRGLTKLAEL